MDLSILVFFYAYNPENAPYSRNNPYPTLIFSSLPFCERRLVHRHSFHCDCWGGLFFCHFMFPTFFTNKFSTVLSCSSISNTFVFRCSHQYSLCGLRKSWVQLSNNYAQPRKVHRTPKRVIALYSVPRQL